MPTTLDVLLGIVAIMFTGGLGWWAHFVTTGASKAHTLAELSTEMQEDIRSLSEGLGEVKETVANMDGKLDILVGRNEGSSDA